MKAATGEVNPNDDEHEREGNDSKHLYPAWGSLIVDLAVRVVDGIGFTRIRIWRAISVIWHTPSLS